MLHRCDTSAVENAVATTVRHANVHAVVLLRLEHGGLLSLAQHLLLLMKEVGVIGDWDRTKWSSRLAELTKPLS